MSTTQTSSRVNAASKRLASEQPLSTSANALALRQTKPPRLQVKHIRTHRVHLHPDVARVQQSGHTKSRVMTVVVLQNFRSTKASGMNVGSTVSMLRSKSKASFTRHQAACMTSSCSMASCNAGMNRSSGSASWGAFWWFGTGGVLGVWVMPCSVDMRATTCAAQQHSASARKVLESARLRWRRIVTRFRTTPTQRVGPSATMAA